MVKFRTLMTTKAAELSKLCGSFVKDKSGATAIEYGLIAGLISVVIIGAVTTIGTNATTKFQAVADNLK